MQIEPVTLHNVYPACLRTAFWEAGRDVDDVRLTKELWLTSTLLDYGTCGFSIPDIATILFAPPSFVPGAGLMNAGPVSPDAVLITSLFASGVTEGVSAVLIDAVLAHLLSLDIPAVEAFGWRSGSTYGPIGLISEQALLSAGFSVLREDEEVPLLRLELPPADGLLAAAEVEELLRVCV